MLGRSGCRLPRLHSYPSTWMNTGTLGGAMALYAFDGTWNDEKDAGEYNLNTNVVRLKNAYDGSVCFKEGVGKRHGLLGKVIGGAFGVGGQQRTLEACLELDRNFAAGDTDIDIIGFSRGAALAVHFANTIAKHGVCAPVAAEVRERGRKIADAPRVRFLGIWDLVASFGIPIDIGLPFNRINLGYRLNPPKNVSHCYHALALDDLRQTFRPTRIRGAHEVWFRGVHSDVGGGNDNLGLNAISMRWMVRKALAVGLPVKVGELQGFLDVAEPTTQIGTNTDLRKNRPRTIRASDRVHYTVAHREGLVNPPTSAQLETEPLAAQAQSMKS